MKSQCQTMIRTMPGPGARACLLCVFLLTGLAAGMSALAAATNEVSPAKRYATAHESMVTADWLLKHGMNEDAATLYNEAFKSFQQLAADYPRWQTGLVAFRINYCRAGLDKALQLKRPEADGQKTVKPALKQPVSPEFPPPATPAEAADGQRETAGRINEAVHREQALDFKGALEIYQAVLAQHKQDMAALGGAGRCFLRLGMLDKARDLLFQWSAIPSPDNGINSLLALILCHDRQFARAIQLIEIVINEDNSNAAAHVILGVALAGMGQNRTAMAEMQKAIALNPRLSEAHYNLAGLMFKNGPSRKTTASAYYLNALKFGGMPDPVLSKQLLK